MKMKKKKKGEVVVVKQNSFISFFIKLDWSNMYTIAP